MYGKVINLVCIFVNLLSNMLMVIDLVNYVVEMVYIYGFEYEILEKEEMEILGMGVLLVVN